MRVAQRAIRAILMGLFEKPIKMRHDMTANVNPRVRFVGSHFCFKVPNVLRFFSFYNIIGFPIWLFLSFPFNFKFIFDFTEMPEMPSFIHQFHFSSHLLPFSAFVIPFSPFIHPSLPSSTFVFSPF